MGSAAGGGGGGIRTVFQSAHRDGVGDRPVADSGPGQHPDLVRCPLLQLVNDHFGLVESRDRRLIVRLAHLHKVQFVVLNAAVRTLRGRRQPRHGNRSWTGRFRSHVSRWCSRNYTAHTHIQ